MSADSTAAARLAASWLLWYPDEALFERLDSIADVVAALPAGTREPLTTFLSHVAETPLTDLQRHYVAIFDMRRRACPYLTFWTHGDTRNRGEAMVRFKRAYAESGHELGREELPDHIAVLLEYAAVGDPFTGEALLVEHRGPIALLRDSLAAMDSAYVHVLDAVLATLPDLTPEIEARIAELAVSGPPVEEVGLEPFDLTLASMGAPR